MSIDKQFTSQNHVNLQIKTVPKVSRISKEVSMRKQNMVGKSILALIITMSLVLVSFNTVPAQAEAVVCSSVEQSELMVSEGLTVTWDSAFECENVSDSGDYQISVGVSLAGDGETADEYIIIESLVLSEGLTVSVEVEEEEETPPTVNVNGLPLILQIGESGNFDVSGMYELIENEELSELNLLFLANGIVEMIEETTEENQEIFEEEDSSFELGISLMLKGEEPEDEDDEEVGEGPSDGFYCIQSEIPHPSGKRLAELYGVDYLTLQEWFCEGFGWGQIMLALQTGMITGDDPGYLLEQRKSGMGWGEIWQDLGLIGRGNSDTETDSEEIKVEEENGEKENGKPDFSNHPKDKEKDKDKDKGKGGKPDFAGPPDK